MKAVSLCSGVGMLDLAATWAGIETVAQVEYDADCIRVLEKHYPNTTRFTDLRELSGHEFGDFALLYGGIPCQPYSGAGKKLGAADPRDMWPHTFRIIRNRRPRWVLIENVSNFVNLALDQVWTDLETEGYQVGACVLPACTFGAPHKRERCFTLAYRQPYGSHETHGPLAHSDSGQRNRGEGVSVRRDSVPQTDTGRYPGGCDGDTGSGNALGNAQCERLEERTGAVQSAHTVQHAPKSGVEVAGEAREFPVLEPRLGRAIDGITARLDGSTFPARPNRPQKEYEAPRVVSERVHKHAARLKQLGNGVVPQQAYPIFALMVAIDRQMREGLN